MQRDILAILLVLTSVVCNASDAGGDTKGKQAELDAACETARQTALEPKKAEIYQECVDKFKKSAEVCEQEVAGYNGNRVNGSPLFYDLPACEAAFEYRKNHNRSD